MPIKRKDQRINLYETICIFIREGANDTNGYQLDLINCKLDSGEAGFRFVRFETEWFEFNAYKDNPVRNRYWLIGKILKIEIQRPSGFETGLDIKITVSGADKTERVILEKQRVEYAPGFNLPTSDAVIEATIKGEHSI